MKKILLLIVLVSPLARATVVINPHTGRLDVVGTSSLAAGSTDYIQNTSSPTISTQVFNVYQGQFNTPGFIMTDSANCTWNTTILTTGNLVTTLIGCPAVAVVRGCTTGIPLGILLSITCP